MKKSGINKAIVCKKCGHKVGYITIKPKLKKKMVMYGLGIALALELVANAVVYFVFK